MTAAGSRGETARADPVQHVWVHYDYMVGPNGESYAPDPASIQLVVDAFAAHGIDLHVDPAHMALPYSPILDFKGFAFNDLGCVSGPGEVAEFTSLKAQYFHPNSNHEWHYAIFADRIACNDTTGIADLPGDDFVVSLGGRLRDGLPITPYVEGGTFMHELGHNLGLHHGGDEDEPNYKSNYLSVMNYRFQYGIPYASTPGSTSTAGLKLDYSEEALPTLEESHLNETLGIGATLPSDRTDITFWSYPLSCDTCPFTGTGPASGPIDWNGNGTLETDVAVDLNFDLCDVPGCTPVFERQHGFDDWAEIHQYLSIGDKHPKTRVETS